MRFYLIALLLIPAILPHAGAWAAREVHVQPTTTINVVPDTRIIVDSTGMIMHVKHFQLDGARPAVEIDIITGGGCSPEAQTQGCLGPPASFKTYTVYLGDQPVFAVSVNIMLLNLTQYKATLEIAEVGGEVLFTPEQSDLPLCDSCDFRQSEHP